MKAGKGQTMTGLGRVQRFLREPVNGLTHCVGAVLAVVGLVFLVLEASNPPRPWHITTYSVFGMGMILLYTVSTLYHWLPLSDTALARLRKLDHMMIFILIAATYTPLCLIPLRGSLGWSLFGSIWAIAIFGIIFKIFWIQAPRWISAGVYVFMGWLALAGIGPIVKTLQPGAVFWLFAGGLFYSVGALIYAVKRPDPLPNVFGFHEIFHIFVLMGSFSHFWTIYRYVSAFS